MPKLKDPEGVARRDSQGSCLLVKLLEKQSKGVKVTRAVTFLQLRVNCKALFANDIGENCRVMSVFYNRTLMPQCDR